MARLSSELLVSRTCTMSGKVHWQDTVACLAVVFLGRNASVSITDNIWLPLGSLACSVLQCCMLHASFKHFSHAAGTLVGQI